MLGSIDKFEPVQDTFSLVGRKCPSYNEHRMRGFFKHLLFANEKHYRKWRGKKNVPPRRTKRFFY